MKGKVWGVFVEEVGSGGVWGVFEEGNRVERGVVFEKRRGGCRCGYIYIHVRGLK